MTILTKQRTYVNDKGILGRGLKLPVKREFTSYEKALNMLRSRKRNAEKMMYAVNNSEFDSYDSYVHSLFTAEHLLANSGTANHFVAENLCSAMGEFYTGYGAFTVASSSLDAAYLKAKSKKSRKAITFALELCKTHLAANKIGAFTHFITFTQPTLIGVGLEKSFAVADYAWSLFRKRKYFVENIFGAVIAEEFTLGEPYKKESRAWAFDKDGFHIHRHLIAYGKWLKVEQLKIDWTQCLELAATKFGYELSFNTANGLANVNRQTVWNDSKAIEELGKYICKNSTFDDLPASEIIAVEKALQGKRTLQTFGKCNKRVGTQAANAHFNTTGVNDGEQSQKLVTVNENKVKKNYLKATFQEKLESGGLEHARIYLRNELGKRRKWRIDNFLERFPSALVTDLNGNEFKGSEYVPKRITEH
jgi:viroplasmin and RNaseH domain-containing protein